VAYAKNEGFYEYKIIGGKRIMKYVLKEGERNIHGICPIPFVHAQIYDWGSGLEVFSCCPAAVPGHYGTINSTCNFESVWNSIQAKNFRNKLIKNDYSNCDLGFCNIGAMKPQLDYLNGKEINISDICGYPLIVKFSHDRECNLMCTTCRDKMRINTVEETDGLNQKIDDVFLPLLKNADIVYLAGDGEVFFSKHYKMLIKRINETYPDIKYIINTNGMLLNKKNCDELNISNRIQSVIVSIISTRKETYEEIMRGAKWKTLINNLDWLLKMKRDKQIIKIYFNYVVQRRNYKEMVDFISFAEKYEAEVRFIKYNSWGTSLSYDDAAIFNADHPELPSYIKMLRNPIFKSANCYLDPISQKFSNMKYCNLYIFKLRIIQIWKYLKLFFYKKVLG
jgi:uncharacterized Fe-S cluster-containing radical SAM superfamily protein